MYTFSKLSSNVSQMYVLQIINCDIPTLSNSIQHFGIIRINLGTHKQGYVFNRIVIGDDKQGFMFKS